MRTKYIFTEGALPPNHSTNFNQLSVKVLDYGHHCIAFFLYYKNSHHIQNTNEVIIFTKKTSYMIANKT